MKIYKKPAMLSAEQNETILAMLPEGLDPEKTLFWDIETTGFSRRYDSIYLMGYFYWEGRTPYIEQHLISSTAEEIGLLENFLQKIEDYEALITYNGDAFDIPFVQDRLKQMRVSGDLKSLRSIDLYKLYRPYASFFGWKSCRLKALECFLGLDRKDEMDGGELIEVFYEYCRTDDPGLERTLLLHNYEDILNLPQLLRIHHYVDYLKHTAVEELYLNTHPDTVNLIFRLKNPAPLTMEGHLFIHKKSVPLLLSTEYSDTRLRLTLPLRHDVLRYYLPNYKEYYILPSGQLLHKSLDAPPNKKTATRAECFLSKKGCFIPSALSDAFTDLHPFRLDYKDKNTYYELEELMQWIPQQNVETLQLFLLQFLNL